MSTVQRFVSAAVVAVACLLGPTAASADVFSFGCITNNSPTDCAILEAQIEMEVTAGDLNTVNFYFTNGGTEAISLTDVYFSDLLPALLGNPVTITYSSGVSFSGGCSPGNLPGGEPYGFTTSYCADSDSPVQPRGVNPGEWLNLAYTLQGGATIDDVLAAIYAGDYRVGIKVQGFDSDGSEAGLVRVPEPTALTLLGTGLLFTPLVRRRLGRRA
jgi:hypothetical protein